jgi:hypothetical protein
MSTAYQASRAKGTNGDCRASKCRHTVTLERTLFEALRESAMANGRGISEEMVVRLMVTFKEPPKCND